MSKVTQLTFGMFLFSALLTFIFLIGNFTNNEDGEGNLVDLVEQKEDCEITRVVKTIRGVSMSPLLEPEQDIVLLEGFYNCNLPSIDDVVVLNHANRETPLIKVIKAGPEDKFQVIKNNDYYQILVNEQILVNSVGEHYLLSEQEANMISLYERDYGGVIPRDAYLILGDNVLSSIDSTEFGLVGKSSFIGKVEI